MSILFWGITLSLLGKVLLVVGILKAHGKISHNHKIDKEVLHTFHTEKILTILGLILILLGYFLEMYFYGFTPFNDCEFDNCAALLKAATSN